MHLMFEDNHFNDYVYQVEGKLQPHLQERFKAFLRDNVDKWLHKDDRHYFPLHCVSRAVTNDMK